MAGRISLVEEYENKDMIVQVKKCLDQTEAAVEASETARDVSIASAAEAHEASTNANSASAQAQTAANTVATYGARLQAVEDESAGNRSSIQNIDGEITDIYNDLTNVVKKVGDPGQIVYNGLELRGTNRTPDTVVGQLNDLIVNAKRLIQEIDSKLNAYEQMVRTTGNQTISGTKIFSNGGNTPLHSTQTGNAPALTCIAQSFDVEASGVQYYPGWYMYDKNNSLVGGLFFIKGENGNSRIVARVRNSNGTRKEITIANGDVI